MTISDNNSCQLYVVQGWGPGSKHLLPVNTRDLQRDKEFWSLIGMGLSKGNFQEPSLQV